MISLPDKADWDRIGASLGERGYGIIPRLLDHESCEELVRGYDLDQFRSTIVMARHGFGSGEYRYYRYPLPTPIGELRETLYERSSQSPTAGRRRSGLLSAIPLACPIFSNNAMRRDSRARRR